MLRNSIKQMLRTPFRTFMFFVLISCATAMLAVGVNLWQVSIRGIDEFEALFTTIATVEQKEDTTDVEELWDAETQSYSYIRRNVYDTILNSDILNFDNANYLVKPKKRPYFGAYVPDYQIRREDQQNASEYSDWLLVLEVTPISSGKADPLEVQVVKQLNGHEKLAGYKIKICDHSNPTPLELEAGKNYIFLLNGPFAEHGWMDTYAKGEAYGYEYRISQGIKSSQQTIDGTEVETDSQQDMYAEVTAGFYDSPIGKAWISLAKDQEILNQTIPVQPVDRTKLLNGFYHNDAVISEGRDITDEEYNQGKKVCLVPRMLAELNQWEVGDAVKLPLYYANYGNTPIQNFSTGGLSINFSLLNAEKERYCVFAQDSYTIVGIYNLEGYSDQEDGISDTEIIIPYGSVKNSWVDNIVNNGPMKSITTSFMLPNGEIEAYRKAFDEQKKKDPRLDKLEIRFYDKGYSELKEGIENRKVMAYIFLAGGGVFTVLILMFFCHLFIVRQEKRTAIERSLGVSKRCCMISLLSGMTLLLILGVSAGGIVGYKISNEVGKINGTEEYYDHTFTKGYVTREDEDKEAEILSSIADNTKGVMMAVLVVIALSGTISTVYIRKNLKNEPLYLLSGPDE